MRHVTHTHTNTCGEVLSMSHTFHMCGHDSFTCVAMTHSYEWPWLIHICDMTHSHMWHDSFTCVTWLIHICDMTHSHMWHDSSTGVFHMCDMTHSHVCEWVMSHAWMSHGHTCGEVTMRHVTHVENSYRWVMSHLWMSHGSRIDESCHRHLWHVYHAYAHFFTTCVRWIIPTCYHKCVFSRTTRTHVCCGLFTCATWLIHIHNRTHPRVYPDAFTRVTRLNHRRYALATTSRLLKSIGLFCKRAL